MCLLRKFCIFIFCFCLGSALCAQGTDFDAAKQRLETDKEALLKAAAVATGASAVLTGAFVLRQYLHGMKSLGEIVAALPEPPSRGSLAAQNLAKEKTRLQREAADLEVLYRMIHRKEIAAVQGDKAALLHRNALKQTLRKKYHIFDLHMTRYRQNYAAWTGQKTAVSKAVSAQAAVPAAKMAGRRASAKVSSKTPLILLFALWITSDTDPASAAQAQRLADNPALVFTLSPQEEEQIRRSSTLTEIYVHIAQSLHELVSLPQEQLQALLQTANASRILEQNIEQNLLRQKMRHAVSR